MNSHYLALNLFNEGKLARDKLQDILTGIRGKDVELPLMALKLKMVDGDTLKNMDTSSSAAFGKDALQKGLLKDEQLQRLQRQIPGETLLLEHSPCS